jgi:hypothetical protein
MSMEEFLTRLHNCSRFITRIYPGLIPAFYFLEAYPFVYSSPRVLLRVGGTAEYHYHVIAVGLRSATPIPRRPSNRDSNDYSSSAVAVVCLQSWIQLPEGQTLNTRRISPLQWGAFYFTRAMNDGRWGDERDRVMRVQRYALFVSFINF